MKTLRTLVLSIIAVTGAMASFAVTDKEMDEAKAITAKEYLRWVNDGSGYLDEFSVKSMSELNSKLKAKEKENIAAFNAVKVPSDYASWDKAKLIEFWAVTFFNSPGLEAKGKGARNAVKKKLSAMTVSDAPVPVQTQPEPLAESTPAAQEEGTDFPEAEIPTAEEVSNEQQDILADQNAIEKDMADAEESRHEEKSNTWVYVMVLSILVAVVIWLVVYAANLMKRQSAAAAGSDDESLASLKEEARLAITKKDAENKELRSRLQKEEEKSAELGMEIERMKLEHSRLMQQIKQLREEKTRQQMPLPGQEPSAEETMGSRSDARQQTAAKIINVIYLGRTNRRGIFVRADRRFSPGNSIYKLDTNDGLVGTFHIVDSPDVLKTVFANPVEYLEGGCTGEDLEDTIGVSKIVTVSAGTAIFENGYWKVLRKTQIRYE